MLDAQRARARGGRASGRPRERTRVRWAALVLAAVAACGAAATPEGRVTILGDSVLAWNDDGFARALAEATGRQVVSRARSGAWVDNPAAIGPLRNFAVANQVRREAADWVVVNGGANDLMIQCGCGACDRHLDRLVSADGMRGDLPELWRDIRARTGARVLILGYYGAGPRLSRFSKCGGYLDALDARAARFAAATDWARFVDAGSVMGRATPEFYDADAIHPSEAGSRALARLVAREIGAP